MPADPFLIGKVPQDVLRRVVYSHTGKRNPRLLLGPGIGRDIAAIKNKPTLILTTDPITGTSTRIGEHSVYVNANDIATAGAKPVWYLCTILLPRGSNKRVLEKIMEGIDKASRQLGITVARGHTEVTRGIDRPIVSGFMIGERKGRLLRAEGTRVGDVVLMTATAGIEGTAIISSDHARLLKKLPSQLVQSARQFSRRLSIVPEALALSEISGVRVMHDPTEGGVLNGCWELSEAADLGIEIWADKIPVANQTRIICEKLRLDPLKLMSSGCLLAVVEPSIVDGAVKRLQRMGVRARPIGKIRPKSYNRKYFQGFKQQELKPVPRDELFKLA